jgi:hypothetical protein
VSRTTAKLEAAQRDLLLAAIYDRFGVHATRQPVYRHRSGEPVPDGVLFTTPDGARVAIGADLVTVAGVTEARRAEIITSLKTAYARIVVGFSAAQHGWAVEEETTADGETTLVLVREE